MHWSSNSSLHKKAALLQWRFSPRSLFLYRVEKVQFISKWLNNSSLRCHCQSQLPNACQLDSIFKREKKRTTNAAPMSDKMVWPAEKNMQTITEVARWQLNPNIFNYCCVHKLFDYIQVVSLQIHHVGIWHYDFKNESKLEYHIRMPLQP